MPSFVPAPLVCPTCGERFTGREATGLDLDFDPAVRAAVFDLSLPVHRCPACAATVLHERGFAYTDVTRRQLVLYRPGAEWRDWRAGERWVERLHRDEIVGGPPSIAAVADEFRVRVVYGLPWLREKLVLWDAGLDDRVFEAAKRRLLLLRPRLVDEGRRLLVLDTIEGEGFAIVSLPPTPDRPALRFLIERALYDAAAADPPIDGAFVDLRRAG